MVMDVKYQHQKRSYKLEDLVWDVALAQSESQSSLPPA